MDIDPHKLGSPEDRRAFKANMRTLDVSHLKVTDHLSNLKSDDILKRELLAKQRCIVRLYMLEAFNLSSRDNGSPSDPYLMITCNDKVYNERANYQLDEMNPKFYKCFDFEGIFPGCSPL